MVLHAPLVLSNLTVQLVDQIIDGRIQILVLTLSKQVPPRNMDVAFCHLPTLFFFFVFNTQQHLHIHHLIKMLDHSL